MIFFHLPDLGLIVPSVLSRVLGSKLGAFTVEPFTGIIIF